MVQRSYTYSITDLVFLCSCESVFTGHYAVCDEDYPRLNT